MKLSRREIIGVIIWWAEGTKSRRDIRWKNAVSYPIEITNTNPAMIKIFLDFLIFDLKVNKMKIKLQLQIHEGDNQQYLENYWSNITGISTEYFNKTIVRPKGNKIGKSLGTCKIRFADKLIYHQLKEMLEKSLNGIYQKPENILRVYEPGENAAHLVK